MFCSSCGTKHDQSSDYCTSCGARMTPPPASPPPAMPVESSAPQKPLAQQSFSAWGCIGFLFPIIGLIAGLVYLAKPDMEKKKVGKQTLIFSAIGLVIALMIMKFATSDEATSGDSDTSSSVETTAISEPAPEPSRVLTWTPVITLSGNSEKRSAPFQLGDGQKRLKYQVSNSDMCTMMVYVVPAGSDLMKDGGFPEVTAEGGANDITYLSQGPGEYYLDVKAANCSWSVTIEEEK